MIKNILRLAELAQKDILESSERHEAVTLAQAMFGTQVLEARDSVVTFFRRKGVKSSIPGIPGLRTAAAVTTPAATEKVEGSEVPNAFDAVLEQEAVKFDHEGVTYKMSTAANGKKQFRAGGKLTSQAAFAEAYAAAAVTHES